MEISDDVVELCRDVVQSGALAERRLVYPRFGAPQPLMMARVGDDTSLGWPKKDDDSGFKFCR